ncbi:serine hydrolase domain-containing protein [Kribbella sp. NPDC004875]|uniref:serine hydrolase domain-containing protein n=1 Tax=Kribbella sp. NPDC004875 TaxID=3364107 RepID=UPI0036C9BFC9
MSAASKARDELRRRMPALLAGQPVPGIAVGVCDATSVLWSAGFGTTREGGDEAVGADTMFGVQSCSKMYTATAVLIAVQQGLVELDVPITRYLPEFRVNSAFEDHPERFITLRHLLSHTAGFTHEAPVGSNYLVGRESFAAHCESISSTWLRFPVGHHFEYSNLGIDLAGYVLQRRSGLPFHEFVRRTVLAPLGMTRTTFDPRVIARATNRALGHAAGTTRVPLRVPMVAAGGLYTTVNDACRYIQFHLTGGASLLDPALLAEMYEVPGAPQREQGYGLGLGLARATDLPVRGHGGGGFGFLSDIHWSPEEQLGVVVLTNSTNHSLQGQLSNDIFQDLVPRRPRRRGPSAQPVAVSAAALAGEYTGRGHDPMTLTGDGTLIRNGTRHQVEFVGPLEFRVENELFRFRDLDGAGRPAYLESSADGFVRYRNEVPPPDPAEPDGPWNRDYAIHASGVRDGTARLRKENGVLLFDHWGGGTLRLHEHVPGIYVAANGETLDLTRTPPTYANVGLHPL